MQVGNSGTVYLFSNSVNCPRILPAGGWKSKYLMGQENMDVDKVKWMAAVPYLLVLLIVVNGNVLGNYDIYIFGVQLSLLTLIPYLIYHFVNRNHKIDFISLHTKRAMSVFIVYFVYTIVIGIVMNILGLGIVTLDPFLLSTYGIFGLLSSLLLFAVVLYAIITATQGSIRAFKLILPNKSHWRPNVPNEVDADGAKD